MMVVESATQVPQGMLTRHTKEFYRLSKLCWTEGQRQMKVGGF